MPGYPVVIRTGRDYTRPPRTGVNLMPANTLTVRTYWLITQDPTHDNTQPETIPVPEGMSITWTTDEGKLAGRRVDSVPPSYTPSRLTGLITVQAPAGANPWRAVGPKFNESQWITPDGTPQTVIAQASWSSPGGYKAEMGLETDGPNTDTYIVTDIGIWDQSDPRNKWHPLELNPCLVPLPVSITHGRSQPTNQPDAPSAVFSYLGPTPPCQVGDVLEITTEGGAPVTWDDPDTLWADPAVTWDGAGPAGPVVWRFNGEVSQLKAVEVGGAVTGWDVTATGHQARLGFAPVDITRPTETDIARVTAIAAAAGVTIEVRGAPGVTLTDDAIDTNALNALHEVCQSSGGVLWADRDGTLVYGTLHRATGVPSWQLSCELILDGVEWDRGTQDILNHLVIKYGPQDTQTQDTYRDDPSINAWGYRHTEISTLCATSPDAGLLAQLILARRAQPHWVMPGVIALEDAATREQWAQLAGIEFGDTAILPVATDPAPTPGISTQWTVEGWVEVWDEHGWRVQLALSEYRFGALRTWEQNATQSWRYWADNHTWTTALVEVP